MHTDEHDHPQDGHGHGHDDDAGHGHGHAHDQGVAGMWRYLGHARSMWRSEVNEAVVARVAPAQGERVVDIGAGAGAGTVRAAATGADVIAVEPTPYMRRVLGVRRLMQRGRSRITVVDGAAEATGIEAESVDAVWAVNSMHHWTDPATAVGELARILRPGGRVLLADEDFDDPDHPDYDSFDERQSDHRHHFSMIDPDEIAAGLRAAGLDVGLAGKELVAGAPTLVVEATKPASSTTAVPEADA